MTSLFPEVDKEIEKIQAEQERKRARIKAKCSTWHPATIESAEQFEKEDCRHCSHYKSGKCYTLGDLLSGSSPDIVACDNLGEIFCLKSSLALDDVIERVGA